MHLEHSIGFFLEGYVKKRGLLLVTAVEAGSGT